ncbi:MAG: hypothetical protein AAGA83_19865 [Cyanobacteria bacterium P01_F01_bin.116]
MITRSIRKSVSFGESEGDRALLDAIAAHQSEHEQSFSDLCKQALHQYLLGHQEQPQSVLLFMELQQQIAQLNVRVAALEDNAKGDAVTDDTDAIAAEVEHTEPDETNDDPVLSRLSPLLEDF